MPWIYQQSSGKLSRNGRVVATGYAGKGPGKNNPGMESTPDVGPLPKGKYTIIGHPFTHSHTGAFSIRLQPAYGNIMYGRAGFLIHGESARHPGMASNGCIIMPLNIRQSIWSSGDREVEVIR
ncbi:tlde1 domain-containing protein [Erwinia papayae]|uniref:Tlde1 domain-containing protein n=1 Tax=Erwinia papayae TaxID=206499 RepID=A0ABV3N1M4_9GAMM